MKKKHEYKYPKTKELITKLKPYWQRFKAIESRYYKEMFKLEKEISNDLKIDEIEFFFVEGECEGIGNVYRTMELIHRKDLE